MKLPKINRIKKVHRQRMIAGGGVLILTFSVIASLPVHNWMTARKYTLNSEVLKVVGEANTKLANKLVLDNKTGVYQFNAEGKKTSSDNPEEVAQRLQQNVTGNADDKGLYSVDLPLDSKQGMTVYDNNSQLSFKLTPQFEQGLGRKVQDRLVYPLVDGVKAVYTVKGNGIKEDIVYQQAPKSGEAEFKYSLELPESLEARLQEDGSLGIFSANPNLFGNISFGSDDDREKVESARRNAPKDNLVFSVPRPVIVATDGNIGNSYAWFRLEGDTLTVKARELNSIKGVFSIDPSVVVTSTSDFSNGNDEGGVEIGTNEIKRAGLSGATTNTWVADTDLLPQQRSLAAAVVYNGFIYITGGRAEEISVDQNTVLYAPINPDGSTGAWVTGTAFTNARYYHASAVYNGYIYIMGGRNAAGTRMNDVQYAKINTDGSVGAWAALNSFTGVRNSMSGFAANGYLYFFGGFNGTTYFNDGMAAPIRADGTIGTWVTTTTFTTGRYGHGVVQYNDYVYLLGGVVTGGATTTSVEYARLNSDGTVGTFSSTTAMPNARYLHNAYAHRGYLYFMSGAATVNTPTTHYLDVQYAPMHGNGSIGSWSSAGNYVGDSIERESGVAVAYQNRLYQITGRSQSVFHKNVIYATINPAGATSFYTSTTSLASTGGGGANAAARYGHASSVFNGYIYVSGGYAGASARVHVQFAIINANGTIGAWTTTTALPTARTYHTMVASNGFLIVMGGSTTGATSALVNTVHYAPLNGSTGAVGAWTATTSFATARYQHTSVENNGYVYVIGGWTGTTYFSDVQYALICNGANNGIGGCGATAGTVGTWNTTTAFSNARFGHSTTVAYGYIYLIGGSDVTDTVLSDVQYALICNGANNGIGGCGATAGTVGTWNTTQSLPTFTYLHRTIIFNSHIYVVGGVTDVGNTEEVRYAKIGSDGTLGAWVDTNGFNIAARNGHAVETHIGNIYVLGGWNNTTQYSDVQYARINNGGAGGLTSRVQTTNMTEQRSYHSMVASNGYVYVLGGKNSATTALSANYAKINGDGTLGAWATTTSPPSRVNHTAIAANGYVYIIGGSIDDGGGSPQPVADVFYAPILGNGGLGTWISTSNLSTARLSHTSVLHNNYVYAIGGTTDDINGMTSVEYAVVNANGTLGVWSSTTNLTEANFEHASVTANGHIYVLGGVNNGGGSSKSTVYVSQVGTDGSLGAWRQTTTLPSSTSRIFAFSQNGHLYTGNGFYAVLHSSGNLGGWRSTQAAQNLSDEAGVATNGFVYSSGGNNGPSIYLSSSYYNGILSIPRYGMYSKLVDLGSVTTLTDITYGGNLGNGQSDITYRIAGADGVFSAAASSVPLVGTCVAGVSGRYVLLNIWLDDTSRAVFQDTQGTIASLQDVTLEYGGTGAGGVAPDKRLRSGKQFLTEIQQPLDVTKALAGAGGC